MMNLCLTASAPTQAVLGVDFDVGLPDFVSSLSNIRNLRRRQFHAPHV